VICKKFKLIGITGSTGLLGQSLKKKLRKLNNYKLNCYKGDITNKSQLKKWFKVNSFCYVIHLAAIVPVKKVNKNINFAKKVNIGVTKNIINEINKKKSIKWFFFSSSSHVYQFNNKEVRETSTKKPFSIYGKTKLEAEKFIEKKINKKIKFCVGRIFSLEGKNKAKSYFLPGLLKKIRKNKVIEIDLNQFRDFIHVDDVAEAVVILLKKEQVGIYNIASGKKTRFYELINLFSKLLKRKIKFKNTVSKVSNSSYANIYKIKKAINWKVKKKVFYIIKDYLNLV